MEAITVAMIVYCVALAGLVVGISTHRARKRRRNLRAFAAEYAGAQRETASLCEPSAQANSPHDGPSAKHAA